MLKTENMKFKLIFSILFLSSAFAVDCQNEPISVFVRSSSTEFKSMQTGMTTHRTSSNGIYWQRGNKPVQRLKLRNCSGIGQILTTDVEATPSFVKARKQFKLGLLGAGLVYAGVGIAVTGLSIKLIKSIKGTTDKELWNTPLLFVGMGIALFGGIYGTIYKSKGYKSLLKSADIYNKNLDQKTEGHILPPFQIKLGYDFNAPVAGISFQL